MKPERGRDVGRLREVAGARLWARVERKTSGCWEWTGARSNFGYGQLWIDGVRWTAHRLAYVIESGQPVAAGMFVCHRCDNPPCCNPAHLFIGTNSDNIRDAASKGRLPRGDDYRAKQRAAMYAAIARLGTWGRKAVPLPAEVIEEHRRRGLSPTCAAGHAFDEFNTALGRDRNGVRRICRACMRNYRRRAKNLERGAA